MNEYIVYYALQKDGKTIGEGSVYLIERKLSKRLMVMLEHELINRAEKENDIIGACILFKNIMKLN